MKKQNELDPKSMIQHVVSQYKINQYKKTHTIPKVHTVGLYDADQIVHRQNKRLLQKNLPKLAHRSMTSKEAKALDTKLSNNQKLINALDIAQSEPSRRKGTVTTFDTKETKFDINDVKSGHLALRWAKAVADDRDNDRFNDDNLANRNPDSAYIKGDALDRVAPKGFPKEIQHINKIKQEAPATFKDAVGQIGTSSKAYEKDLNQHHNISGIAHKSSFNDFNKSASKELGRQFHGSKSAQQVPTRNQSNTRVRARRKALAEKHSQQR